MGEVWKAEDTRLGRTVAVKILAGGLGEDPRARQRFQREARAVSSLNHPHICTLHDIGLHHDLDFLVMEYLEGETLAIRLHGGPLPLDDALRHGADIAEALHEAHRTGVIHRDLKPGNIMLTRRGAKLLDFGLAQLIPPPGNSLSGVAPAARSWEEPARTASTAPTADLPLTEVGSVLGTMPYMAPEQLEGRTTDQRTDIFALGCVLHEMVTGAPAFAADSKAGLIAAILTTNPPPVSSLQSSAPPLLDQLVSRCVARDPQNRWPSALDLVRELRWLAAPSPAVRPVGAAAPASAGDTSTSGPYRITYFKSTDGTSIAVARGGSGSPLMVLPTMLDTIDHSWSAYAAAFPGRELILYDRRGTGLSARGTSPSGPEPFLNDAQAVLEGCDLDRVDLLGTLLGTLEAAWLAAEHPQRIRRLALRIPVMGLSDWADIPDVRASLAAMDENWDFFTEAFAQLVLGWGSPNAPALAARLRASTSRAELRGLIDAFMALDLRELYGKIRATTLVEHHPGYFFGNLYSQRIASLIDDCQMTVFSGAKGDFLTDLSNVQAFLEEA